MLSLTSTARSLVSPAPHSVCQALDVGGANTKIAGVAGENDFCPKLVVGTIDNPPSSVVQGEGAETWAHHH